MKLSNYCSYFILDTKWLNKWSAFVEQEEAPEPGPISTYELFQEDKKILLPYILPKMDYRAVCPMVYYVLKEFHGKDDSPEIARYECNIFGVPVQAKDLIKAQMGTQVLPSILLNYIQNIIYCSK